MNKGLPSPHIVYGLLFHYTNYSRPKTQSGRSQGVTNILSTEPSSTFVPMLYQFHVVSFQVLREILQVSVQAQLVSTEGVLEFAICFQLRNYRTFLI